MHLFGEHHDGVDMNASRAHRSHGVSELVDVIDQQIASPVGENDCEEEAAARMVIALIAWNHLVKDTPAEAVTGGLRSRVCGPEKVGFADSAHPALRPHYLLARFFTSE